MRVSPAVCANLQRWLAHVLPRSEVNNPFSFRVIGELPDVPGGINFITADGTLFTHPLHHIGKSRADLPVLAFDTFRHMFLFKKFDNIHKPGVIEQFVADLHSGVFRLVWV